MFPATISWQHRQESLTLRIKHTEWSCSLVNPELYRLRKLEEFSFETAHMEKFKTLKASSLIINKLVWLKKTQIRLDLWQTLTDLVFLDDF